MGFGNDAQAVRLSIIMAQWDAIEKRFGVRKAEMPDVPLASVVGSSGERSEKEEMGVKEKSVDGATEMSWFGLLACRIRGLDLLSQSTGNIAKSPSTASPIRLSNITNLSSFIQGIFPPFSTHATTLSANPNM